MAFESQVLASALSRLEARKFIRGQEIDQARKLAYQRDPYIKAIEKQLRLTISDLMKATLDKEDASVIYSIKENYLKLQQEKREHLKALDMAPHALSETPYCPHCSDTGWFGRKMCKCLHDLCAEEQLKLLSSLPYMKNQEFSLFSLDYYSDEIPEGQFLSSKDRMERIFLSCQDFSKNFPKTTPNNLLFTGETGVGKTFLSACIAKEVAKNGYSVVYEPAKPLFYQYEIRNFTKGTEEEVQAANENIKRYTRCDLLIVDDLGTELTNKATDSVFYELINDRILSEKHTIFTTNFPLDELIERYSNPVSSRLQGEFTKVQFYGEDIRLAKMNQKK